MDFEVDASAIQKAVASRKDSYKVKEDWLMPSGKPRTSPAYFTTVRNSYLDKTRDIKAQSAPDLHEKAREQIEKWKEQEIRAKVSDAKQKAMADLESYWTEQSRITKAAVEDVRNILVASLSSSPVLNLDTYFDHREFTAFTVPRSQPASPRPLPIPLQPKRKFMQFLVPPLWQKALQQHAVALERHATNEQARQHKYEKDLAGWEAECDAAQRAYEEQRIEYLEMQSQHNEQIQYFIEQYETGTPEAVKGYLDEVFSNVKYPADWGQPSKFKFTVYGHQIHKGHIHQSHTALGSALKNQIRGLERREKRGQSDKLIIPA